MNRAALPSSPSPSSPAGSGRLHLTFRNRHPTWRVNTRLLRRIALAACAQLPPARTAPPAGALAIVLLEAQAMARLNERFLGHHGPTDVITFDYAAHEPPGDGTGPTTWRSGPRTRRGGLTVAPQTVKEPAAPPGPVAARVLHGDVFICLDEARRQARAWGTTWSAELVRYVVHGLLHLWGYDDLAPGPRRELKRIEHRLVRRLAAGFPFNRLGRAGNVRP